MKVTPRRQDRAFLLANAKEVARRLALRGSGTRLRIHTPKRAIWMNTDGWRAIIGDLGIRQPRLEIWLDRFSGYPDRKLWACFHSEERPQIMAITRRVAKSLWPVREVTERDTKEWSFVALEARLGRSEFNAPVLERLAGGQTFYGIYDPTRPTSEPLNHGFCGRAADFFEDVARALPYAAAEDEQQEVYPHFENRKLVKSHLRRERSRMLASRCKERDDYRCQVCGFRFTEAYGKQGADFAEAHHRIPLAQLPKTVQTELEELVTVCSNCHRMLHRMDGKRDDIKKLKAIVGRHRK